MPRSYLSVHRVPWGINSHSSFCIYFIKKIFLRILCLNFFLMFINIWERETDRQSTSRGGAEREGDTESEAGSRLRAVSTEPNAGLELTNQDHDLSWSRTLNQLSHPGAPGIRSHFICVWNHWDLEVCYHTTARIILTNRVIKAISYIWTDGNNEEL